MAPENFRDTKNGTQYVRAVGDRVLAKPDAYLRRPGQSRRAGAARQRLPPSIKLKRKSAEEIGGAPV
jgi:hypothetical protein